MLGSHDNNEDDEYVNLNSQMCKLTRSVNVIVRCIASVYIYLSSGPQWLTSLLGSSNDIASAV